MQLTKRTRDKSNGNQESTTSSDGGDSLPSTSASLNQSTSIAPIVSPRKSIREYTTGGPSGNRPTFDENTYLLYQGRQSYLMIPISKALTWTTKLSIYYHHEKYLNLRLWLYFFAVLFAGLVHDYILTPSLLPKSVLDFVENYLKTSKRNALNLYFVKLGWAWTLLPLLLLIAFTRIYYVRRSIAKVEANKASKRKKSVHFKDPLEEPAGDSVPGTSTDAIDHDGKTSDDLAEEPAAKSHSFWVKLVLQLVPALIRLGIATLIWYYSVEFFVDISHNGASCRFPTNSTIVPSVTDKFECKNQGYEWHLGFDISGHIFLMIFSTLIRIEELAFLLEKFDEFAEFRYLDYSRSRSMNYATPYRFAFSLFHLLSLLLVILMVVITLIWDFMILQTAFFYHTMAQKLAGFAWAVLSWAVTYKALFVALPALRLQVAPRKH